MNILGFFKQLLKGRNHAKGIQRRVSGRDERHDRIIHSIPVVCKQAISDVGGIRMLAQACAAERGGNTGTLPQDSLREESRTLIAAARTIGCLVDAAEIPGTRYSIRTGESEVRMLQAEQLYYKIKNPFAKLHLKRHSAKCVLFEHVVHNVLFPDCRLEFLGVAEVLQEARLVFRQKAVRADARPDDRQIASHLRSLGLEPEGRYGFGNEYVFITDVGQDGDNVLLDDDGKLRFIDPIIGLKQPLLDLLDRILAAKEKDSNVDTAAWEAEIDALVYRLYGLTDDEIAVVEGN